MSTGEVGFTSEGRESKRYTFEPPAVDDYRGKLLLKGAEVQKFEDNPVPYVGSIRIELLDTAGEGQKSNKSVFANLYTGISPNSKGNVQWDNQGGPQGLLNALGAKFSCPATEVKSYNMENSDGEVEVVRIVNPVFFLKFLKQFEGRVINLHTKIQRRKGMEPKGKVDYFIPLETETTEEPAANDDMGFEEPTDDGEMAASEETPSEEMEAETAEGLQQEATTPARNGLSKASPKPHVVASTSKTKGKPAGKGARR